MAFCVECLRFFFVIKSFLCSDNLLSYIFLRIYAFLLFYKVILFEINVFVCEGPLILAIINRDTA